MYPRALVILLLKALVHQALCSLEVGVWDIETTSKEENFIGAVKNVYKDTKVNIKVECQTESTDKIKISIGYVIRRTPCWEEYLNINKESFGMYYNNPAVSFYPNVSSSSNYIKSPEFETECNQMIDIHPYLEPASDELPEPQALASSSSSFFSTQDVGSSSTADIKTRYIHKGLFPNEFLNLPIWAKPHPQPQPKVVK